MKRHIHLTTPAFLFLFVFLFCSPNALAQNSSELIKPTLQIDIPTVTFSDATISDDNILSINYLGDYISGLYKYLLGIATTIAIVMMIVSGLQWAMGGTSKEAIGQAQSRIKRAVTGLILLLSTYLILSTVNPTLTVFQPLELDIVQAPEEEEDDVVSGTVATSFATPSGGNIYGAGKTQVPEDLVKDVEEVAQLLAAQGYGMSITSSYRTVEQQIKLIRENCKNPAGSATCDPKEGHPTTCILKDNDPANCPHTTGRALDIWGTDEDGFQCVVSTQCSKNPNTDECRKNECQAALIEAMKSVGFCNHASEAWHFEKPKMSTKCY